MPTKQERDAAAIQEMRAEAQKPILPSRRPGALRPAGAPAKAVAAAKPAQPMARALLLNYRRGRHTQRTNQFLLEVRGIDSRAKAKPLAGKRVVWTTPGGKAISGRISGAHGNKGVVRARFTKGLPPQAIGKKADVY